MNPFFIQPPRNLRDVVPSDTVDQPPGAIAYEIHTAGNVALEDSSGAAHTFSGLQVYDKIILQCKKIKATGTTAALKAYFL